MSTRTHLTLMVLATSAFANADFTAMSSLVELDAQFGESSAGNLYSDGAQLVDIPGAIVKSHFVLHPQNLYLLDLLATTSLTRNVWTAQEIDITSTAGITYGTWNYMSNSSFMANVDSSVTFTSDTAVRVTLSQATVGSIGTSQLIIDGVEQHAGLSPIELVVDLAPGTHTVTYIASASPSFIPSESNFGGSTAFDYHLNVSAVPEPATIAALGLGTLALLRRRKRL